MELRKKILNLEEGLNIYSQLLKDEEAILIPFVISQYVTVCRIDELLPEYLADLQHNVCKESLCIDFDQMTSVDYWMEKLVKMRNDMERLGTKPMKEHGFVVTILGFCPETTWELYEAIEQKVAGMVEMLKEVKQRIKAAPPSLYGNFFRYQKSLCDRRAVEARYARWKRDIGVPNIELLKDKEAQEVVEFLKKKVFQHIRKPSTREVGLVDLDSLNEHMPDDNTFPDEFPYCYTRFLRYAKVEDGIYHINYNAYGQYLFDFYYRLTPDERQAFIEIDIMLDLIKHDIAEAMKEEKRLPAELASDVALYYWKRLQESHFVDNHNMLSASISKKQAMYIADLFAEKLKLKVKWKLFEELWNIKNLAQEKWEMQQTGVLPARYQEIDRIFSE